MTSPAPSSPWSSGTIRDHRRVIFTGDGYSAEWEIEAERRGLPNKKYNPRSPARADRPQEHPADGGVRGVMTRTRDVQAATRWRWSTTRKIINIEALTMPGDGPQAAAAVAINAYMGQLGRHHQRQSVRSARA